MTSSLYRVTHWECPEGLVDTIYGNIRFSAWLRHECVRWGRTGIYAEIKTKRGMQSLWATKTPERGWDSHHDEQD